MQIIIIIEKPNVWPNYMVIALRVRTSKQWRWRGKFHWRFENQSILFAGSKALLNLKKNALYT